MTLRKASTVTLFVASFLAAAMLSTARPVASVPALSVTASATQPMAAAGSDSTATQGVAPLSTIRVDAHIITFLQLAKKTMECTTLAPMCTKTAPGVSVERTKQVCQECMSTCRWVWSKVAELDRPIDELRRWRVVTTSCLYKYRELTQGSQKSVRGGTSTT